MTTGQSSPGTRTRMRWLRILLPTVVIVLWLIGASIGGPTFGKISSVSSNDQASFLPATAESTQVSDIQEKFTDSDALPAIVVLESKTEIGKADLAEYSDLGKTLGDVDGVSGTVAGPIPSKDGKAVEFIAPVSDTDSLADVVDALRATAGKHTPSGVTAYVTGPAGLTADLTEAFGGIDGILLVVAVSAVFVILLLVYRSIVLPILVLLTSVFALAVAILVVYWVARAGWVDLNGQSQGILSILVIGAATDYSLLLVARFRETLVTERSRWTAILHAWRAAFPPIAASGSTVILALLCLLFSDLNSNKGLGPIAAIGIAFALLSALTLLPMFLAVFGRAAFWPFRPRFRPGGPHEARHANVDAVPGLEGVRGLWRRVSTVVAHRPRAVWIVALVFLGICSAGIVQLKASGVPQTDLVLTASNAADGQKALSRHFPGGLGSPVVIVADKAKSDAVKKAAVAETGISSADFYTGSQQRPGTPSPKPVVKNGKVLIDAVLTDSPDSDEASDVVRHLRRDLPDVDPNVLVGGVTATNLDTNTTAEHDLVTIIPIVLAVILVILIMLLRSVLAPVLLIATVVVSYISALGVSALVFNHVFDFVGADPAVPLFGFVFLVALGVDYNIFLMTRVREESAHIGTRPGILRGLSRTGSVITSAGIVLAATFAALAVIPILFLAQIAFIVAFGVLLDTIVVRSLLVPALSYDIGRAVWWPSKLSRSS